MKALIFGALVGTVLGVAAFVPCNSLQVSWAGKSLIDLDGGRTPACPVRP